MYGYRVYGIQDVYNIQHKIQIINQNQQAYNTRLQFEFLMLQWWIDTESYHFDAIEGHNDLKHEQQACSADLFLWVTFEIFHLKRQRATLQNSAGHEA